MSAAKKKRVSQEQAEALRSLPSVEELLETATLSNEIKHHGRQLVVGSARIVLEKIRNDIRKGKTARKEELKPERLAQLVIKEAAAVYKPSLKPLINATGVVVHTNLGRSLLAPEAIKAVDKVSLSYSNLEYNLEEGSRGSRHDHITRIITALTGAEDALVVNNNAAAVLLALTVFASGREVIVSRGELIEIGGSFRIPEILAASTAKLVEVGTTNKTKLSDYQKHISDMTAVLLHVHTSNYAVVGFTASVPIGELVKLGHEHGLVVMDDLGSGALADLPVLSGEPSVHESLASGADIVTFSGDKLLGGPQAGIIVGRAEVVEQMKAHPMARALRVDKMTLAALQATLALYLNPEKALTEIPTLRMLSEEPASIKARAERLAVGLKETLTGVASVKVEKAAAKVGGGALPLLELDSYVCAISPRAMSVDDLAAGLRAAEPPVIGRIHKDKLLLDARTILPGQVEETIGALRQVVGLNKD
jgi:L-seryl-tRNA(Ser) seleniumtransferase